MLTALRPLAMALAAGALIASAPGPLCRAQAAPPTSSAALQPIPQADRISHNPDLTATTILRGHLPAWAGPANRIGSVPGTTEIRLTFVLTRSPEVEAAFQQLLADQQNPASPRFHRWLTPEQVGLVFGPTDNDIATFTDWLRSRGISIGELSKSRTLLHADATVSAVAAALSTNFNFYSLEGAPLLSADSDPSLPSAFAGLVSAIEGINEVPDHPLHSRAIVPISQDRGARPELTSSSGKHYITPGDFAVIYDLNPSLQAGYNGAGQKVAIIGRSRVLAADITNFQTAVGLTPKLPNTIVAANGADPGLTGDGNQDEATLDVDRVLGTAPGAQADLVIASSASGGIETAAQYAVNTINDPIMTISFGSCERSAGLSNVNFWNSLFSAAAAQGISVFVSSGDSATAACDAAFTTPPSIQYLSINYICSSSYATCVGGTEFADFSNPLAYWGPSNATNRVSALSYIPEGAWNEPVSTSATGVTTYIVQGGGGGASVYIAKPSWQTGTGVPADGFRDVPDVSFSSSAHDGYYACLSYAGADCSSSFIAFGGTSAAAPSMAAIAALLDQRLGEPQGNLNPLLYRLAANPGNQVFHDATPATSGVTACLLSVPSMCNNSTVGVLAGAGTLTGGLAGYALTPGYDQATGWGSVDIANLLAASAQPYLNLNLTLAAPASAITTAQSTVFTATIPADSNNAQSLATGTVQFLVNGINIGSPITLTSGKASTLPLTFPAAGIYGITSTYSGDSVFKPATSNGLSLSVALSSLSGTTASILGTATSITAQQSAGFTATIVGSAATTTLTGFVQFYSGSNGLGAPVPVTSGKATLAPISFPAGTYTINAAYSGDVNFAASVTSVPASLTVTAVPTTATVSGTATTLNGGQTATFTAAVIASAGTPTGKVQFLLDTYPVGTLVTLINGTATLPAAAYPIGSHVLSARYSGDAVFAPSTSNTLPLTVTALVSTTTLTVMPTTITIAGSTVIGANVAGPPGDPIPTGSATLKYGATTVGTLPLANGGFQANLGGFPAGTYPLFLAYSGDSIYAASTSPVVNLMVTGGTAGTLPSTTTISVNPATITTSGSTLVGAYVTGVTGNPVPTGSATLKYGTTTVGSLPLNNGSIVAGLSGLLAGTYPLFISYSGDSLYAPSVSATSNLIVTTNAAYTLSPASPSLTFTAGANTGNTNLITVATTSAFSGGLSFSCSIAFSTGNTAAIPPTCNVTLASITFPAASITTVSIGTVAPHAITISPLAGVVGQTGTSLQSLGGTTLLAFLVFVGLPIRARQRRNWPSLLLFLFVAATLGTLLACGSGSPGSAAGSGTSANGTTTGLYIVSINTTNTTNAPTAGTSFTVNIQ